ncbi:hypothetical protein MAR_005821 [Mya arenaria]|uniref:Uncharacterized protein n=1 Tax=Mya arenaria TaxID=6604 RepID=A0ABY7F8U2_MYAAR|nr:hypothetical protein MAR_005821 [Mya arenaria]
MTAVNYSKSINTVVVGEDTDLLVLLFYYFEDHVFSVNLNKEIEQHGERAMILLYTDRQIDSINDLRVRFFIEKTSSNSLSIDPETLPPTSSATKYHSLRTYYQMLQWKGLDENPCDYGWMLSNGLLVPNLTDMAPAPANILKVFRSSCKTGCRSMSYVWLQETRLNCSSVCRYCDEACCNQLQLYNIE